MSVSRQDARFAHSEEVNVVAGGNIQDEWTKPYIFGLWHLTVGIAIKLQGITNKNILNHPNGLRPLIRNCPRIQIFAQPSSPSNILQIKISWSAIEVESALIRSARQFIISFEIMIGSSGKIKMLVYFTLSHTKSPSRPSAC